jgi:hypothetical protein
MVIGRRRLPHSSSELAGVGARPRFTPIESQVSTPCDKRTGARRGFFFTERAKLDITGIRAGAPRPQR